MYPSLVTGANDQQAVRLQEAHRHAYSVPAHCINGLLSKQALAG